MKVRDCYQTPPKQIMRGFQQKKATFTKDSPTVYEIPARSRSRSGCQDQYRRLSLPRYISYDEDNCEGDEEYFARDRDNAQLGENTEEMEEEERRGCDASVPVVSQKTETKTESL
jgi:hypothetical protein